MAFQGDSIFWVEVEKIVPNPFQPRREFNEEKLKELSESIRMYGILQPLTVTRNEIQREDGAFYTQYELIAGERRLRASKLAGLAQVPVIIRSGQDTEQEKLELAIIENLQREDLNAVDRAVAFKQLAEVFKLSHGQVAKKVGRSREYVSNTIRLLGLPEYMLNSLRLGEISEGHARTLLMLKDRVEEQDVVYREILLKKLSVREVERITRKIASDKVRKKNWINTDAVLIEIEREFTDTLGTRVQISKTDFGGKLTIDYFSDEDLQKLLVMVKTQGKITDFHKAEGEVMKDDAEALEKITDATVLESVQTETLPQIALTTVEEAIASEHSVSEVIEDVVVERAEYAGVQEQVDEWSGLRHGIQSYDDHSEQNRIEVEESMKVPASNYVAYETRSEAQDVYPQFTPRSVAQVPEPSVARIPETVAIEVKKDGEDDDLYSMKNFNL